MSSRNIKFSAMKEVITLLIILCACANPFPDSKQTASDQFNGIKSTKYYQIANQTLTEKNITTTILSKEEMEAQRFIVYGSDTIYLVQSKLLFCLRDSKTDTIYIFLFNISNGFRCYTCTKEWNVISQLEQVGEGIIYPDINRKVALDSCLSCLENIKTE